MKKLENVKIGQFVKVRRGDTTWFYNVVRIGNDAITVHRRVGDYVEPGRLFSIDTGFEVGSKVFSLEIPTTEEVNEHLHDIAHREVRDALGDVHDSLRYRSRSELNEILEILEPFKIHKSTEEQIQDLLAMMPPKRALAALQFVDTSEE